MAVIRTQPPPVAPAAPIADNASSGTCGTDGQCIRLRLCARVLMPQTASAAPGSGPQVPGGPAPGIQPMDSPIFQRQQTWVCGFGARIRIRACVRKGQRSAVQRRRPSRIASAASHAPDAYARRRVDLRDPGDRARAPGFTLASATGLSGPARLSVSGLDQVERAGWYTPPGERRRRVRKGRADRPRQSRRQVGATRRCKEGPMKGFQPPPRFGGMQMSREPMPITQARLP